MKDYYFLMKKDDLLSFSISIEHFIDTGEVSEWRLKDDESVRLFYIKDTDRFTGRFLQERSDVLSSLIQTIPELIADKQKRGYQQITAKNYARYRSAIISRYQQQITQEHEKAKKG